MTDWLLIVVQGVLTGGLYALFAAGLSMTFGIMRVVNLAHGDLIILACFMALLAADLLGLPAFATLFLVVPLSFGVGYLLQQGVMNKVQGGGELPPLLTTFGIAIIIQNGLTQYFGADTRKLNAGDIETMSFNLLPNVAVGVLPVLMFLSSVAIMVLLHLLFFKTAIGRAFRAASDDPRTLSHMGYESKKVYAIAMGVAMAVCAAAAVFLAVRTQFTPMSGPTRLLFAFEAVIIGGMGSLWGTFAGAILLGVAQAVGAAYDPVLESLAGHALFFAVLLLRPNGLFAARNAH